MAKVVAVIFLNDKKEILLYLRDDKLTIPYPNTWALLGGHLENNETKLEGLKREINEEIGYVIKNPEFLDKLDDGVGNEVYVYKDFIDRKVEEINLTEGQKLVFFKFEDALNLKIPKPLKNFLVKHKQKILS